MDGHAAFLYDERIRAVFKQRGLGVGVYHRVLCLLAHAACIKRHACGHVVAHSTEIGFAYAVDIGDFFRIAIACGAAGLYAWADGI